MTIVFILSLGLLPLIGLLVATIHSLIWCWHSDLKLQFSLLEALLVIMGITPSMYLYRPLAEYLSHTDRALGLSIALATLQIFGMFASRIVLMKRLGGKYDAGQISIHLLLGSIIGFLTWLAAIPIVFFYIEKPI